jgi:hypothetical protein
VVQERYWGYAGLLMGHALLWKKVLPVNFNACFIKVVLERALTLDDLR